jgi:hypothetical protein
VVSYLRNRLLLKGVGGKVKAAEMSNRDAVLPFWVVTTMSRPAYLSWPLVGVEVAAAHPLMHKTPCSQPPSELPHTAVHNYALTPCIPFLGSGGGAGGCSIPTRAQNTMLVTHIGTSTHRSAQLCADTLHIFLGLWRGCWWLQQPLK